MNEYCEGCPLKGRQKLKTLSNPEAKVIVITGIPTDKQVKQQRVFMEDTSLEFKKIAETVGLPVKEFSYHPSVRCHYDKSLFTTKDKTKIHKCCRQYTEDFIKKSKAKCVVPLGAEAASAVAKRSVKITKARGSFSKHQHLPDIDIFTTINPTQLNFKPESKITMEADFSLLNKYIEHGFDLDVIKHDTSQYSIIYDLQFLIDQKPKLLAFDLETLGTHPFRTTTDIMTMQFCATPGVSYLLPWNHPESEIKHDAEAQDKLLTQLKELLDNTELLGHNVPYDVSWLKVRLGINAKIAHDTIMQATLLDENYPKNLDDLTKRYVPEMAGYADEFNQKYDKARMDLVPLNDILHYGAGDTDACLRLHNVLYGRLIKDERSINHRDELVGLLTHYNTVSIPSINMFIEPMTTGIKVNLDQLAVVKDRMKEHISALEYSIIDKVPQSILDAHEEKGHKLTRTDFLIDILFKHPEGLRLEPKVWTDSTKKLPYDQRVPSTSAKEHLPYFLNTEDPDNPISLYIESIIEWKKANKMYTTYIKPFEEKYVVNGRIYPSYTLYRTVTGRTSSYNPNFQNIPKHSIYAKWYREIFVWDDDWVMLEADYSQAELRLVADRANEQVMLNIYRNNGDIHKATAMATAGINEFQYNKLSDGVRKALRQKGKPVNFGLVYGMQAPSLVSYSKTQYGVDMTLKESEVARDRFFKMYPALEPWHQKEEMQARAFGYVRSFTGRVRHLPSIDSESWFMQSEAIRGAINSPIQETGSSLGLCAMCMLQNSWHNKYIKIVGFVHDALYLMVRKEYLVWGVKEVKKFMEGLPLKELFGRNLRCAMVADVSIMVGSMANAVELDSYEDVKQAFNQQLSKINEYRVKDSQTPLEFEWVEQKVPEAA